MNLCSVDDLSDEQIRALLDQAEIYAQDPKAHRGVLEGHVIATAFFEPSTRTRLSFEAAALRLGAGVIGFSDGQNTSAAKGETLADSSRVLGGYADALVIRHPEKGAAHVAAQHAGIPVINAGDGAGEHPTQTLLDLFTMRRNLGELRGRTVAVLGDLRYGRTVHSLVPALHRLGAKAVQVPAPGLEFPTDIADIPTVSLDEAAATCDVLYVTRVQKERMSEAPSQPIMLDRALLERTQSKAIVMHPLPRVDELNVDLDAHPAAKYFEQARNGVPVRMAVLAHLLGVSP
ncbi:MAG: aspartate carbamoyltransferase [Thermoplasmatota archaeon]